MALDANKVAAKLNLKPHPEGGQFREYWRSDNTVTRQDGSRRTAATAIYFLLDRNSQSAWHYVRSDELWLWQGGGAITIRLGGVEDTPASSTDDVILGPDFEHGHILTFLIPAGTWQSASPLGDPVLVSCVVAPGFEFEDFRLMDE